MIEELAGARSAVLQPARAQCSVEPTATMAGRATVAGAARDRLGVAVQGGDMVSDPVGPRRDTVGSKATGDVENLGSTEGDAAAKQNTGGQSHLGTTTEDVLLRGMRVHETEVAPAGALPAVGNSGLLGAEMGHKLSAQMCDVERAELLQQSDEDTVDCNNIRGDVSLAAEHLPDWERQLFGLNVCCEQPEASQEQLPDLQRVVDQEVPVDNILVAADGRLNREPKEHVGLRGGGRGMARFVAPSGKHFCAILLRAPSPLSPKRERLM